MGQSCTVCKHNQRYEIDLELAKGQRSNRYIALQFSVSPMAVGRHKRDHLPEMLAEAFRLYGESRAGEIHSDLSALIGTLKKHIEAHDAYLSDPEEPTKYTLEPRAEEISVIYLQYWAGQKKPVRKKAPLSHLLARVDGLGIDVVGLESRYSDPRETIVKTAVGLRGLYELLAKVQGKLDERPVYNVTLSPEWVSLRTSIMRALMPFPEARTAIAEVIANDDGSDSQNQYVC